MFDLIPQIILLLAFGVIVFLVAKNIPKAKECDEDEKKCATPSSEEKSGNSLMKKIPIEKIDVSVNKFFEKLIRRSRISIIKLDSFLQRRLESLRDRSKPKSVFRVEEKGVDDLEVDAVIEKVVAEISEEPTEKNIDSGASFEDFSDIKPVENEDVHREEKIVKKPRVRKKKIKTEVSIDPTNGNLE